ncbi:hypothetical protein [Lysobacter sp. A3-1-A15]|uniref:hypothetical protein n=1 Tax=Novilysobacter viscosus TaxID=3098602 RepID=UPI002EDAD046
MPAYAFRFDHAQFQSRVRDAFAPRKPRHPLVRIAFGLVGLALLAVLVVFGAVVGAAMIAAGLLYKLWRSRGTPVARGAGRPVVEGQYRVLDRAALEEPRDRRR